MISIEQHFNHYLEGRYQFARSHEAASCFTWGRGNHGNSATGQPPAPVTLIESVEQITLTTYLSLRPFYRGVGGWDNGSSSCTRDSARQPRDANVPTGSLGYDVYPANGTRDATSQLFSPVSSKRLGHRKSSGDYTTF